MNVIVSTCRIFGYDILKILEGIYMTLKTILSSSMLGITILMTGCSTQNISPNSSDYFTDYKIFSEIEKKKAKNKISKYKNIIVAPVQVISYVKLKEQTPEQKRLYHEIADYLEAEYKLLIDENSNYKLVNKKSSDTLLLQTAISMVETHSNDKKWNPHTPITMGINVVSLNAYMNNNVHLLGEKRLVDSMNSKVIINSMDIQEKIAISLNSDTLSFEDIQASLDSWLSQVEQDLK